MAYVTDPVTVTFFCGSTQTTVPATAAISPGLAGIYQIAAGGGRAFALEGTSTVYEFDISTPAAPQLVTKISEPVQAMAA